MSEVLFDAAVQVRVLEVADQQSGVGPHAGAGRVEAKDCKVPLDDENVNSR